MKIPDYSKKKNVEYEKEYKVELTKDGVEYFYNILLEEKDKEIERLTFESTKWESKFYDEAKKVDKAIEYCKELMLFKKNSRQYLIGKCMLEILGGVDKE